MDHQLILTANCEKYCNAYFVVEDLILDQGQVFQHCSDALHLSIKLVKFILYYCGHVLEIMLWCCCVCIYVSQGRAGTNMFVSPLQHLTVTFLDLYLIFLTLQISETKAKCFQIQGGL